MSFCYGMSLRIETWKPHLVGLDRMKKVEHTHANADSLWARGLKLLSLSEGDEVVEAVRRQISSHHHRI
jgi:hypothetical protein